MKLLHQLGLISISLLLTSTPWAGGLDDFKAASSALDQKDYQTAVTLYARAIESGELPRENLALSHYNIGVAYAKRKPSDFTKSVNHIWRYIQMNPNDQKARETLVQLESSNTKLVALARASKMKWSTLAELQQNVADAEQQTLLEQGMAGWKALNAGNYNEAIKLYTESIELGKLDDFQRALVYYDRSVAYEREGFLDKAVADMERFIQLFSKDPDGPKRLKELRTKLPKH